MDRVGKWSIIGVLLWLPRHCTQKEKIRREPSGPRRNISDAQMKLGRKENCKVNEIVENYIPPPTMGASRYIGNEESVEGALTSTDPRATPCAKASLCNLGSVYLGPLRFAQAWRLKGPIWVFYQSGPTWPTSFQVAPT